MSGGIKPSFVFPTEARAQTRNNNNNNNNTSHTWPTQSNAAVPVPPPPKLRQTATTTSNPIIAPTITSSRTSVSLSTQPALPRRSASVSSNGEGGGAANGSAPLPAPPPPPARRYREMGATPVLLPECLTASTNGQITTAQLRHGSDATQPRRRKSGDAGPQSQTYNHHSSTSISSGALPSIPAHLQKRSSTVQTASQGRPWQQQSQQSQQRRRSSVNAGSANSSTTAPPPTASASMTASEEPTRVPTGHAARRSVSFIVPDEMARPGLSEFSRTLASATQSSETIADMHRGTISVQEHQTPQTEAVPAPGFAAPIIVHRPPTRGNGRVEESNAEQSAGQMPASLGATERRSKASNNTNSSGVTASTPQKAEGGLSATLSFRDRVNKGVPPPPRTRLQRRRPGKRRTPQGSLSGSVASSTTSRTGERRRRGLGHTSTSLLGHGLNGASGLHNEADWQRVHALRVLLYVTWFHTRMMRIVRRARAQQHWQRVLAPRAAFVLQCFWRRVRQRRRVEKLCAVRLLVPWLRLKLTRLRQAKEASARLLQRVFRAERTRVWMRGLYDCMYVHRALRILQRHVRRWEDQKLLRFLRSQREERNLMIERCRHESTRLVRNERAGWLTLLRMAHEQLGFTASDPTAVISHVNGTTTSDKIVNSNNDDNVVQPVVVCLASPLHTLETCQAYLTQLFTPESENYLSAYKAGNTPPDGAIESSTTAQEATTTVAHEAVTQASNNDDGASSGDGVLDAFVELLGRVEAMERKELERDLLHEHALFCEPVRRISYAIRLRSAVPRLYASLLLSLPTVADMRRAVELFHAEQRARTLIIAEYNAIPLLALHRPGFSATAEQRHRTLLALMSLADANGDATHYTPVDHDEHKVDDVAVENTSLALYDEQQAGQGNTSDETNLLRQMKAAVQADTSDHVPSNEEEESATPKPRRLRVMMQPQLTPITAPGAMSPVPLLQMRSQLLQVRRRQRISLSAITDSSAHTSHNEDDDTTYVNVPVESTAEEEVTAIQENNNNRYSEEQHPLPLRSSALTSSSVSEHERKWQAASRSVTASDNDDSVSAMESVGWGAAEVSEQTASKSSTTLNAAVSASVVAPPQPPSPPPRRRHRSQFESAASVVSGPFAAEHDTQ